MKNTPDPNSSDDHLRQQAEEQLKNNIQIPDSTLTEADSIKLYHEIEVQHIELDMQHEELLEAQLAAQRAIDIYDFAPTGYFSLTKDGKIIRLNLYGAQLLNKEKVGLIDCLFGFFVMDETKPIFIHFLEQVFQTKHSQSCEICISNTVNRPIYVFMTGTLDKEEELCMVTAVDITEHKRNEEKLRYERGLYQDIVNNQPAGIYRIRVYQPEKWWDKTWSSSENPPYSMELASDRFCEILGITREDFEKKPTIIVDLIHPKDKQDFIIKNEEANNRVIPYKWDGRLVVNCKTIWIHLESIPRVLSSGDILWTGIMFDNTDQKEKELALKESEYKYRELVDNSPDAISIYTNGKIVFINQECLRLMGATHPNELMGKPVIEFVHPDYRAFAAERMMHVIKDWKILPLADEKFMKIDGTPIDVEVKSMPIIYQNKPSVQLIVRDVTDRKLAEKALMESENKFRSITEQTTDLIAITDTKGTILYASPASKNIFDIYPEEMEGHNFIDFLDDSSIEKAVNTFKKNVDSDLKAVDLELTMKRKDGSLFTGELNGTNFENGIQKGTLVIIRDITERKNAQYEISRSREDFKDLFDNAPVGYHEIDAEGKIVRINQTELTMLGYSLNELTGQFVWKISANEQQSLEAVKDKMEGRNYTPNSFNRIFKRKDGSTFPVLVQDNLLRNSDGEIIGIRTTVQDITERVTAEKEIQRSQEDFKDLFDNAPVGYHEIDAEGRIIRINKTELTLLGYSKEELIGQYIWKLNKDEQFSKDITTEKLKGLFNSPTSYERELVKKDGSKITVLEQDRVLTSKDGSISGIRSSVQDITERKKADLDLQVSEEKFRTIFEKSSVGKSMTALKGKMIVNKAFSQIVGYSEEELSSLKWSEITHKDDIETNENELKSIVKGEKEFSRWEKRYIHKNGYTVWVDISTFLMRDNEGKPLFFITEIYDITDRKKTEIDLRNSEDKFKKAFMTSPDSVNINRLDDGLYLSINTGFTRIMGYTEDDVLGKKSTEINIWANPHDRRKLTKELQEKGIVENLVTRFRHKSGKLVYGMMSASIIELNGIDYILSLTRDITELRNTEIALKQSEERFKAIFEDAPDTMFLADAETGTIVDANKAACELFKKDRHELIGIHQHELHPEGVKGLSKVKFNNHINQLQVNASTLPVENVILCSDGSEIPVEILAKAVIIDNKVLILGTFRDITERRKTIQALRESEELYRNLVLRIPDGVYKSTPEGKFIDVNPAMVKILGYESKEELLNIDIKTQLYFDSNDRESAILDEKNEEMGIFPLKKKDGSPIWIEDHGWYNTDANGEVLSHEGVLRDITDRKIAQDVLREREEVLKKTLIESTGLIDSTSKGIDYEKISNTILELSGAKYGVLNIFDENGLDFTTMALSGIKEHILKASSYVGFEIINKKWKYDPNREKKTENNTITRFESLHELSSFSLPKRVSDLIEKIFNVGELHVVKISKNNKSIGDFTLIYSKGETIRNSELVLLFANQVALYIDRDKADKELRVNEEKYRYLFENNPQPMYIHDVETLSFLEVNQATIKHYGYSKEEFLQMTLNDIRPSEDIPQLLDDINEKRKSFRPSGVWRHLKKNGEIIFVDISAVSINSNGRNARHVMIEDITERKHAEEALKLSEEKFRSITEQVEDLIIINDTEGFIKYASPASREFFHCEPEELNGRHFTELIHDDSIPVAIEVFRAGVEDRKKAVNIELKMKRGDESIFYTELNGTEFNNGDQKGVLTVLHDITSRKYTVEQLRESEEKFRSIAEHTSDLISISDVNGKILYASNASKTIFQFEPDEMCGHDFIEFVDDESKVDAIDKFKKGMELNMKLTNLEFKMKRKDGSTFFGELNGSTFRYGTNYGFLVVIRDITERKNAQEELEEKMNELVRFHNLTVDREMTMIELKKEVNRLLSESGKEDRYKIVN